MTDTRKKLEQDVEPISTTTTTTNLTNSDDYYYFFKKNDEALACVIQKKNSDELDPTFVHSILDTLHVLPENYKTDDHDTDDYATHVTKRKITLCINNTLTEKSFRVLMAFLERLRDLGIRELHENPKALWFYSNNGGDQILNTQNYPPTIQEFLKNEADSLDQLIKNSSQKYNMLIEVGCGNTVNLPLAKKHNLQYLGLEVSPTAVRIVQERIRRNRAQYENADIECINILNIKKSDLHLTMDDKPLLFLPFNLFGNVAPIAMLLARFRKLGIDVAISIYNTDTATSDMRKTYYTNCGYNFLSEKKHETGTYFFSNEGLYTVAYDHTYLTDLFHAFGFETSLINSGSYGATLYARPQPLLDLEAKAVVNAQPAPTPQAAAPVSVAIANTSSSSIALQLIAGLSITWAFYNAATEIINGNTPSALDFTLLALGAGTVAERFGVFSRRPAAPNLPAVNEQKIAAPRMDGR